MIRSKGGAVIIGGAFWTPEATVVGGTRPSFKTVMKKLFENSEQGFAYDPNDLTTMFQDAAGTIPVTAAGQPVGLMKDKSGRNNHAFQTVSASRPVFQQTPILGSELVVNSTFDTGTSGWEGSNGGKLLAVNGGMRLTNTLAAYGRAGCTIPSITGKSYKMSCRLRSGGGTSVTLGVGNNSGSVALGSVYTASTEYVNTSFIFTAQAETTFIIGLIGTTTVGLTAFFDDISVKEIVGYRTDQNYLAFDGVDDFLQTNNIDFTATDKVSLFAGVRKLSDLTAFPVIVETGITELVSGSFHLYANSSTTTRGYALAVTGTKQVWRRMAGDYASPDSAVITAFPNLSASSDLAVKLRRDGVNQTLVVDSGDVTGGGNFGNLPLYIGRRAGTSLPFNGHIYGLIGIGRLTTDSETIALEKFIAKNTGVTLNV